jgi:hypothetical protein
MTVNTVTFNTPQANVHCRAWDLGTYSNNNIIELFRVLTMIPHVHCTIFAIALEIQSHTHDVHGGYAISGYISIQQIMN